MYIKINVPNRFQLKMIPTLYTMLFRREREIHYIGGAEVLPPPLEAERERECILLMGDNCAEARKELIEHNLRLVVYIAKKFDNTGVVVEDLISNGTIGPTRISSWPPTPPAASKMRYSCICGATARHAWRCRSMSR